MPARYYSGQQDYSLVNNPQAAHPAETHEDYDDLSHYSNYRYEDPTPSQPTYADERGISPPRESAKAVSNPFTDHNRTASPAPPYAAGEAAFPAANTGYSSDYNDIKSGPRPTKKAPLLSQWSRRKKLMIFGGIAAAVIIIAIAVGVGVSLGMRGSYNYVPEWNQVQNQTSFDTGAATRRNVNETNDGIGAGVDEYTYYSGGPSNFPSSDGWVSFENMWEANKPIMLQACGWLEMGKETTEQETQYIYDAIQDRANASLVDHRFILAIIMQESHGCVRVHSTTSISGVHNPGLMQSHHGHEFDPDFARLSILQMVQDGTQGTDAAAGYGLVQNLDLYGDLYSAARGYNSGYLPPSGNLSEAAGATACYVSDVANRLTGWVSAENKCENGGT